MQGVGGFFMKNKIPYLEFLPILVIGLVLFKLVDRIDDFGLLILSGLRVLQSVFWAIGVAYVLNPLMNFLEKKFKIPRILAILICYIIVIGLIITLITIVIPMIYENVRDLIINVESYQEIAVNYFEENITSTIWYSDLGLDEYLTMDTLSKHLVDIPELLNSVLNGLVGFVGAFFGGTFKIIIGFIIAVYLLLDKEKFQVGMKKIVYGFFKEKQADLTVIFFGDVNKIFSRYIIGKTIDSAIIGAMCFVGLAILQTPYAALLAIIVGITNMIPYFGPFIGMVPAIILTLFVSPIKAVWVGLFILALQQFDGYYLGPKILGDSVGVSPFWIILGIIVGGSMMGVLGMLLAVPVVAVLQMVFTRAVDKQLSKKDIIVE